MPDPQIVALRRLALQVSVLHDFDLVPADDGVVLPAPELTVPWASIGAALNGRPADAPDAPARVHRLLADVDALRALTPEALRQRARPVGVPVDAAYHPGPAWVLHRLLGGALEFGLGYLGLHGDPDRVELVSPVAADLTGGIDSSAEWPEAMQYLDTMGTRAVELLSAGPLPQVRQAALRPMGDCDVLTLLGSRELRSWLAGRDGTGMASIAVPMRTRGWVDLRAIDPAFVPAAAATIGASERGFARPLLVTADEVALATQPRPSDGEVRQEPR